MFVGSAGDANCSNALPRSSADPKLAYVTEYCSSGTQSTDAVAFGGDEDGREQDDRKASGTSTRSERSASLGRERDGASPPIPSVSIAAATAPTTRVPITAAMTQSRRRRTGTASANSRRVRDSSWLSGNERRTPSTAVTS